MILSRWVLVVRSACNGRSFRLTSWPLFIMYPTDMRVMTKQLDGIRLRAWYVVGLSAAIAAPVEVWMAHPAPRAVLTQGLFQALVAFDVWVWRRALVSVVSTTTACADTAGSRAGTDPWVILPKLKI